MCHFEKLKSSSWLQYNLCFEKHSAIINTFQSIFCRESSLSNRLWRRPRSRLRCRYVWNESPGKQTRSSCMSRKTQTFRGERDPQFFFFLVPLRKSSVLFCSRLRNTVLSFEPYLLLKSLVLFFLSHWVFFLVFIQKPCALFWVPSKKTNTHFWVPVRNPVLFFSPIEKPSVLVRLAWQMEQKPVSFEYASNLGNQIW